jgi:hypothetical protein
MSFDMRMNSAQRASAEALIGGVSVATCAQADNAKANINTPTNFIVSTLAPAALSFNSESTSRLHVGYSEPSLLARENV